MAAAGVLVAAAPAHRTMPLDIIDVVGTEIFVTGSRANCFIVIQKDWPQSTAGGRSQSSRPREIRVAAARVLLRSAAQPQSNALCVVPGLTRIHVNDRRGARTR
jgi:hypothetical protein